MLIVALVLILLPLLRGNSNSLRRLRESRAELRALEEARSREVSRPRTMRRGVLRWVRVCYRFSTRSRGGCGQPCTSGWPWPCWCRSAPWVRIDGGARRRLGEAAPLSGDTAAMPVPDHGTDMQAAIAKLADKLRQHPDDAEGWALLGRTYKATRHYAEARDAFRHALEAAPGDTDLAREYAAAETPDESAESTGAAEMNAVTASDVPPGAGAPANTAHIVVNVALDPKLKDSVGPNDTLFVFAKAAHGPPMPLAITRLTVAQLPARLTLTDAMGMVPGLTLSRFPQVVVGARISKSGNATPQSGDLQTLSSSTTTAQTKPVQLIIAERVD